MKKLFDLRFVIGVFFTVVGLLLTGYHFSEGELSGPVNLYSGIVYLLFGVVMIVLSYGSNPEDDVPVSNEQIH